MGVIGTLLPAVADAGQIWLGGMDPVTTADRERVGIDPPGTYAANDFMDLFRPNAAWLRTASMIQVFGVSTQFLHRSSDDQLSTLINDLRRRHIALGWQAEIMADDLAHPCGAGIPGHTSNAVIRTAVGRVARLGGKIDYVYFDEPVAFGHYKAMKKDTVCNYTIEELVRNIAPQIEVVKTAFPDVKFGDGEPVSGATIGRMDDNLQFAKEFFRQTGVRLSFMVADVLWFEKTFHSQLMEWRRRVHEAGMEYGVSRLFLTAMIIATFVAPAARSESGQPTAQTWVNAFSLQIRVLEQSKGTRLDTPDQWKPQALWMTVAAHTKVAKLIARNIEGTSDADFKHVIKDVNRRHLELALEIGPPAGGAPASEAYGNPRETVQKIRRNGGELRYVDMDEPFFSAGHLRREPGV
jgi:hypothetical protein